VDRKKRASKTKRGPTEGIKKKRRGEGFREEWLERKTDAATERKNEKRE